MFVCLSSWLFRLSLLETDKNIRGRTRGVRTGVGSRAVGVRRWKEMVSRCGAREAPSDLQGRWSCVAAARGCLAWGVSAASASRRTSQHHHLPRHRTSGNHCRSILCAHRHSLVVRQTVTSWVCTADRVLRLRFLIPTTVCLLEQQMCCL
jgi:hypothetical protein